jgi:DNA primase
VAGQYSVADPDTLDAALALLEPLSEAPKAIKQAPIEWPICRPIKPTGLTAKFWRYLARRGFDDVQALIEQYDLSCSMVGKYKDRIIIPFYQGGEQIGWTSRAMIDPIDAPRYLSSDAAIKQTVFNEDELFLGGQTLILVEGPFDALKIDFYGQVSGVRATCTFGTSISIEQLVKLTQLCRCFRKVIIFFDHDAIEPSFHASDWLNAPNVSIGQLPNNTKDPGEMSRSQVEKLIRILIRKL